MYSQAMWIKQPSKLHIRSTLVHKYSDTLENSTGILAGLRVSGALPSSSEPRFGSEGEGVALRARGTAGIQVKL